MSDPGLLNRIGRAALLAYVGSFGLFALEISGIIPDLSSLGTAITSGLLGIVSFVTELLRDQFDTQVTGKKEFRTAFFLQTVSRKSRVIRGAFMTVASIGIISISEFIGAFPDLELWSTLAFGTAFGVINSGIEILRDRFDLQSLGNS